MVSPKLLVLLLPSHGMEDLPDSPEEAEAEELLAAFACLAHPQAAAVVNRPPFWDRADMPPAVHEGDVVLVPGSCDAWMEPTWVSDVQSQGVHVISGHETLEQWFNAVSEAYGQPLLPEETREAFAAVGLMRLFVERFARRMHNFDGVDEHRILDGLKAAAKALDLSSEEPEQDNDSAVASDTDVAEQSPPDLRQLLAPCYDALLEYRDRIHPLEPYLLDVVMLSDQDGSISSELLHSLDHQTEADPTTTLPAAINLMADVECWKKLLNERPELQQQVRDLWPKRRIDLLLGEDESCETRLEPVEIIGERLQAVRRWSVENFGRGPRVWARREYGLHPSLPALLKASGYEGALHLTFDVGNYPEQEDAKLTWQALDRTGIEAFARLPVPAARASTFWQFPERIAESVELDAAGAVMFVRWTDTDPWWFRAFRHGCSAGPVFGRLVTLGEFLTEADGHSSVLRPNAKDYFSAALAKRVALKSVDPLHTEVDRWQTYVDRVADRTCLGIASVIRKGLVDGPPGETLASAIAGSGEPSGTMILNPLPIERTALVANASGSVRTEVPAYGYSWISDSATPTGGRKLVEQLTLQNEHFQIEISEKTGGVKRLMRYGRRGNFLSQQVARRIDSGATDEYLSVQADLVNVIEDTPLSAAIESRGRLVDGRGEELAAVIQTARVIRGQPWFDITIQIDGPPIEESNPWLTYDAVRFAWATEFSTVSQSCGLSPAGAASDRMESPLFVEIDDDPTVTLLTHGQSFHRRSGRTLDTLIAVAGESRRLARFSVGVGIRDPAALALAAMTPLDRFTIRTPKPRVESAWLISIDRRGIAILGLWHETNDDGEPRLALRLQETNGAAGTVTIRLCRPAVEALARDFAGRLTDRLLIRDGAIEVRLREHQMRELVVKLA